MKRNEIITEFKRRYLKNESVTEKDIVVNDLQFFHLVLEEFGSWHKLVKEVGLLNRHLKEREKYFLYLIMKERKERFPADVLRHKNIKPPELKAKIAEGFGTIKKLTHDILDGWNQDRVIYEAHTYFITGGRPELLSTDNPILSENIDKFFADEKHFYDEYQRRFLIQPLDEIHTQQEIQEPEEVPAAPTGLDISALLVAVGYLDKEKADNIAAAEKTSIEEVQEFVNNLDPNMTESQLAEENARMFLAVVNKFGNLSNARQQNVEKLKKA